MIFSAGRTGSRLAGAAPSCSAPLAAPACCAVLPGCGCAAVVGGGCCSCFGMRLKKLSKVMLPARITFVLERIFDRVPGSEDRATLPEPHALQVGRRKCSAAPNTCKKAGLMGSGKIGAGFISWWCYPFARLENAASHRQDALLSLVAVQSLLQTLAPPLSASPSSASRQSPPVLPPARESGYEDCARTSVDSVIQLLGADWTRLTCLPPGTLDGGKHTVTCLPRATVYRAGKDVSLMQAAF